MITLLYVLFWLCAPIWWILDPIKRWVERYADPTTHRAYVVNHWNTFPNDPVRGM